MDEQTSASPVNPRSLSTAQQSTEVISFKPIGYASTWFKVKNATPRQPTVSSLTRGHITISKDVFNNPEHSLENLNEFSHVWVLFLFHKNGGQCSKAKVAPPRLNGVRVGLFSTRTPHRPNPIGLTLAKIEKVEGDTLHLCGLDLLDGTPIIDIKPYIPSYDSPQTAQDEADTDPKVQESESSAVLNPEWTSLGKHQTLTVSFTESAIAQIRLFSPNASDPVYCLKYLKCHEEAIKAIEDILKEDPRSIYRKRKCLDRLYFCIVDAMHVTSWFDEVSNKCEVIRVMPYATRKAMNEADQENTTSNTEHNIE